MKTDKTKPVKTFSELFAVILTGNKEDSRKAAREVRKLLYGSNDGGQYNDIKSIIENAPAEYINITDIVIGDFFFKSPKYRHPID